MARQSTTAAKGRTPRSGTEMQLNPRRSTWKLTLCLAALLTPAALAQNATLLDPKLAESPPAEGDPAFTAEQLAAWTAEMIPIVQRAAGRPFRAPPRSPPLPCCHVASLPPSRPITNMII